MPKLFVTTACFFAMAAVVLGAFGAHGLKNSLAAAQLHTFQTGVTYQFYHALGLLFLGLAARHVVSRWLVAAGLLFIAGILLFSLSLYALSLGGPKWLGPITPLGGLCFIVGWACALTGAAKSF